MGANEIQKAYGVFKPVGHVVVALPPDVDAADVVTRLAQAGIPVDDIKVMYGEEMTRQAEFDIEHSGWLATVGQELNLVKAHRALAERGCSFVIVKASGGAARESIAAVARQFGALRAQWYGHLVIEELIPVGDTDHQVFESPARGLDAQTWSGRETVPAPSLHHRQATHR